MKLTLTYHSVRIIGLLSLSIALSGCGSEKDTPQEAVVRPVKLITLEEADNVITNSYPATIEAATSGQLSFQVSGQIVDLPITEAQQVKAGDLLAKLDQENYQNQYNAARAQFGVAETEYQRAARLFEQDAISKSILDQRKSQRDIAQTQLKTAEKAFADTELVAPYDGIVASIYVKELDTAQAGSAIITLLGDEGMQATANVPATLVSTVNQRKDKKAVVILDSAEGKPIDAEFKEASLEADSSTQTFSLTFTFQPPSDLVVLPGMNATLVLSAKSVDESERGVFVPMAAINSDGANTYVWAVDSKTMQTSKRNVTVFEGLGEELRVTDGLEPGDVIVGAGGAYLAEGMEVRPWVAE